MRKLRVNGHSEINYYTESIITVTGVDYQICDAQWFGLEQFWVLTVKKAVK